MTLGNLAHALDARTASLFQLGIIVPICTSNGPPVFRRASYR